MARPPPPLLDAPGRALAGEVARHALEARLLEPGERVLVAASGGGDSTALVCLLFAAADEGLPLDLVIGHVDHGWRGEAEARADREAVTRLASACGAALHVVARPALPVRTEDEARRWRYRALADLAQRVGVRKVLVAHHQRDQAETVLMRLWRGSGPRGLMGIPARRLLGDSGVEVVRPLLDVHPGRLRSLLVAANIPWREDATNADLARDRARIRARLVALEARGGAASRRLADLARRIAGRVRRAEDRVARRLAGHWAHPPGAGAVGLPRDVLRSLAVGDRERAVHLMGERLGASRHGPWRTRRHVALLQRVIESGGGVDLPRGLAFRARGPTTWLLWRPAAELPAVPGLCCEHVPREAFDLEAFLAREDPGLAAALDAAVLGADARLRRLRHADTFTPFGRSPGHAVPLSRWLAKRGVPRWLRARTLVLVGSRGVAWVPGHRIDAAHAVTERTRRVALVRVAEER